MAGRFWRRARGKKIVSSKKKRLEKIKRNPKGVKFRDLVLLLKSFGFTLERVSGSHHIFTHPAWDGILNIQNRGGEAKPYQVRQAIKAIEEVSRCTDTP